LPFSAAEDLLAGGANVGKLAKLQIDRWASFTAHSGPECTSISPRDTHQMPPKPQCHPPSTYIHLPLPHQLHRIDNDSIRDKTVTMSTNNNTTTNPDSKHLCYKQS
jgi:hypothetical protein